MGMTHAYGAGDEESGLKTIHRVTELASTHDVTPAQLALAWVLAKGQDIVPIPGTKSPRRLEENAAAVDVTLSADEVRELDEAVSPDAVRGGRYPEQMMALLNSKSAVSRRRRRRSGPPSSVASA
jgi:aryl-alcohol dehydrogenase-like predicted oxidoreductase